MVTRTETIGHAPPETPEIVIKRVIDAPRDLVFDAFTDARQLDQWWGPTGFRNTTHELDLRPGGVWRYTMHGPDGTDFPNKTVYVEIAPPERLVYDHGWDLDEFEPMFRATVTLTEQGDQTVVELRSVFPSIEARDQTVKEFGAIEGGKQTLARLAAYVATKHTT